MSLQVFQAHNQKPATRTAAQAMPFAAGVYATTAAATDSSASDVAALRAELKGDIRALKTLLAKSQGSPELVDEIAQLRELVESLAVGKAGRDRAASQLKALGIEGPACTALARSLRGKGDGAAALRDELERMLTVTGWPLEGRAMIALVGPSGVGKTTTAAKLAARARMAGQTVTLVGCDSFRVGAGEQLACYAGLIGAELATARSSDELGAILDGARTDIIIVDTSGRPPTADGVEIALNNARRAGPKTSAARSRHVLLCVPAALRSHDAARVTKRYGALAPTSLAITKIDETDAPAGIVHACWAAKLPVSVACFGPRVPEDIAPATVASLIAYVAPRQRGGAAA